jgi:hypothetical protein
MSRELLIICGTCNKPVDETEGNAGNLWIPRHEVLNRQDAHRAWMDEYATPTEGGGHVITGRGIGTRPLRVAWRADHSACDSGDIDDMYSIPNIKLRTWADLVAWTAQLSEKSWLEHTNWIAMTRGVAAGMSGLIVPVVKPKLYAL